MLIAAITAFGLDEVRRDGDVASWVENMGFPQ